MGADRGIQFGERVSGGTQQKDHVDAAINALGGPEKFRGERGENLKKVSNRDWSGLLRVRGSLPWPDENKCVENKQDRQKIRGALVEHVARHGDLEEANTIKRQLIQAAGTDGLDDTIRELALDPAQA